MKTTAISIYNSILPFSVRNYIYQNVKVRSYKKNRSLGKGDKLLTGYDDYQCIFVHIPKTAGRSIKKSLFDCYSLGHLTINDFKIIFAPEAFEQYFKFAFVRNPWDRVLSTYLFLKKGGCSNRDHQWSKANLSKYNDFNSFVIDWLNKKNIYTQIHFIPQYYFVCDRDLNLLTDYLGRFENLSQDFQNIQKKINVNIQLQDVNKTQRKSKIYSDYYSEESMKIVSKVYSEDIELFKYSF
jgi:hypothetical protein